MTIWIDGVSFVAKGTWNGTEIEVWSKLVSDPIRAALSKRLAAVIAGATHRSS